jgi:hypothetical protein
MHFVQALIASFVNICMLVTMSFSLIMYNTNDNASVPTSYARYWFDTSVHHHLFTFVAHAETICVDDLIEGTSSL